MLPLNKNGSDFHTHFQPFVMPVPFQQQQFLSVVDAETALHKFMQAVQPAPLGKERIALRQALGRVLAETVEATIDVPAFDRSNVDGYAVRAEDTFGAQESSPLRLILNPETVHTGCIPQCVVRPGTATPIATGAMLPRGANAVLMVEDSAIAGSNAIVDRDVADSVVKNSALKARAPDRPTAVQSVLQDNVLQGAASQDDASQHTHAIQVYRAVPPGNAISFAGTDIAAGETVLYCGSLLTSRETGMLAAVGCDQVDVYRKPKVAILSSGDEIIAPGTPIRPGAIYDSNATILADAVTELGGEPVMKGIVPDVLDKVVEALNSALHCDLVLISGGTSKGEGDLNHAAVSQLPGPGILVHGVALKPGKPLCLAQIGKVPLAILPGFPSSAIFTFHEFIAPVLRLMAGHRATERRTIKARIPMRINSDKGRTEFLLVSLSQYQGEVVAYPIGKGSGSVSAFSRADGFATIPREQEFLEKDAVATITRLGETNRLPDLAFIGSHCPASDQLLGLLNERGWKVQPVWVGSQAGLDAARRTECDVAGMHLLDEQSGIYNAPFVDDTLHLEPGYTRMQGIMYRKDDSRFADKTLMEASTMIKTDAKQAESALQLNTLPLDTLQMINRNRGSGTRALIDKLLQGTKPSGYLAEPKSHNAVAAAVAQGRADWGVGIQQAAERLNLGFIPIGEERYDWILPKRRIASDAVQAFLALVRSDEGKAVLVAAGMTPITSSASTT